MVVYRHYLMYNIAFRVSVFILFLSFDLTMLTWLNTRSTSAFDQGRDSIIIATLANDMNGLFPPESSYFKTSDQKCTVSSTFSHFTKFILSYCCLISSMFLILKCSRISTTLSFFARKILSTENISTFSNILKLSGSLKSYDKCN